MSKQLTNSNSKMTLDEYEDKYVHQQSNSLFRSLGTIALIILIFFLLYCCFHIFTMAYEISPEVGYIALAVAVLFVLFLILIPVIRLHKQDFFVVDMKKESVRGAKKHNAILRENIADKMISYTAEVADASWYPPETIGRLAIARAAHKDEDLQSILSELYAGPIRKEANKMIAGYALKVGITSALSQSATMDVMLVSAFDMAMMKELVFLYGFRPSNAKLAKIYATVLQNALVSYGIQNSTTGIGQFAAGKIGNFAESIPILGKTISTIVESTAQGVVNGMLTLVIGYQTIKYLTKEYRLQSILDTIEASAEEDFETGKSQMKTVLAEATKEAMIKNATAQEAAT